MIYDKTTGKIVVELSQDQNIDIFFEHYPAEFRKNLAKLQVDEMYTELENYKIIDEKLTRRTDAEIQEIQMYGRILTKEERLLNKLKPSPDEVKKAENTIEILTLIQEVI